MGFLKCLIEDNNGSGIVNTAGGVIIISIVLAIAFAFTPVFVGIYTTDRAAHEVARYTEIRGVSDAAYDEFARLKGEKDIKDTTVSINTSGHIQLDEEFTVTLVYSPTVKVGTIINMPLSFKRKATGRSEKYWK